MYKGVPFKMAQSEQATRFSFDVSVLNVLTPLSELSILSF